MDIETSYLERSISGLTLFSKGLSHGTLNIINELLVPYRTDDQRVHMNEEKLRIPTVHSTEVRVVVDPGRREAQ